MNSQRSGNLATTSPVLRKRYHTIGMLLQEARFAGFKTIHDWLTSMYDDEALSIREIGERLGMSKSGAFHLLRKFKVEMRPRGGPYHA